jgi:hypothetical protein
LTIPSDVFATIAGIDVFGVFEFRMTVYRPRCDTVTPDRRNAGFPFKLIRRRNEKTTSAAVIGVPSAKRTSRRRSNVYVRPPFDARKPRATRRRGRETSPPLKVSSVS